MSLLPFTSIAVFAVNIIIIYRGALLNMPSLLHFYNMRVRWAYASPTACITEHISVHSTEADQQLINCS